MKKWWLYVCMVGIILGTGIAGRTISQAQMMAPGGYGAPVGVANVPGTAFGGATDPTAVQFTEGYKIIPAISAAQRYDSNVFYAPKTAGLDLSDYVTTVAPQIRGLYAGSLITLNATASAIGEYYAKNEGLNYIGTNTGIALDMSPALDQLRKGTRLLVTETYTYSPQPPGLISGDLDGDTSNPYLRGMMVGRVNTKRNMVAVNGSVPLTEVLSLTGGYSTAFNRFGASPAQAQQPGNLLNSNVQTSNVGLVMRVSGQDSLLATYAQSNFTYQPSGTGTVDVQSLTVGAMHMFTPRMTLTVNAGAQVLEAQFSSATNIGSTPSTVTPKGSAVFMWSDATTSMTVTYDLSASPSYVATSEPLLSQVTSASMSQVMFVPEILGVLSANYSRANLYSSGSGPETSYTTFGGTAGAIYKFSSRTFLSLNYTYMNYDSIFTGLRYGFDRHVIQLNLALAFF